MLVRLAFFCCSAFFALALLPSAAYGTLSGSSTVPDFQFGNNGCMAHPGQPLVACFDEDGAHFRSIGHTSAQLHLYAYGRQGNMIKVPQVAPKFSENRVSYDHGGIIGYWRALPNGVEQVFTVEHRPSGHGELLIDIASSVATSSSAESRLVETGIVDVSVTVHMGQLRYGKLVVTDANDVVLPASMTASDGHIMLRVEDKAAAYPLTVDPLVWLEQRVSAGQDSQRTGFFGQSVSIDGDTAVIGMSGATVEGDRHHGLAYVFKNIDGAWQRTNTLTVWNDETDPDSAAAERYFGYTVAVDGKTIMIAMPSGFVNAVHGVVYVYKEVNGQWLLSQKLTASDGFPRDWFGKAIALRGRIAVIGAPQAQKAYVFAESGGQWTQIQELVGQPAGVGGFGGVIAFNGTDILIGTPDVSVNGASEQGAVFAFSKANNAWTQVGLISAEDGTAGDFFGQSVALDGSTALIGAAGADAGGLNDSGAVYAYKKGADGTWVQTQKFTPNDAETIDGFGTNIGLDGQLAVINAPNRTLNGSRYQGVAYVFQQGDDGTWRQSAELSQSEGGPGDKLGFGSMAISGTTALVGASNSRGGPGSSIAGAGSASFYSLSDLDLALSAPEHVTPGAVYATQVIVTNSSAHSSPAVSLTVPVPAAASYISATVGQGSSCSEVEGVLTCALGPIPGNAGAKRTSMRLRAASSTGSVIYHSASIPNTTPPLVATATTAVVANAAPEATDSTATVEQDKSVTGVFNATDSDGDTLTYAVVTEPSHGTVELGSAGNGTYTYQPQQGYVGDDSFTFKANDGRADSNVATVGITVEPISDGDGDSGGGAMDGLIMALLALVAFLALANKLRGLAKQR